MSRRFTIMTAALCAIGLTFSTAVAIGQSGDDRAKKDGLFTHLSGRNEIGTNGKRGAGDRDGRGSATVLLAGSKVCFGVTVNKIGNVVAGHIHKGRSNQNGPVVVDFKLAPMTGNPGAASGCIDVSASLAGQIRRNPNRFYVNVHTQDFAGGAVRGQLGRHS